MSGGQRQGTGSAGPRRRRGSGLFWAVWMLAAGFLFFTGCGKEEPVVARFGKDRITLEEFRIAYLNLIKQPNTFDSPKLREDFLDELIRRRILAEEARRRGLDRDERLQLRLDAYRNKCLREAHYERVIRPRVRITETQLRQTYRSLREKRRIRHLFARTRAAADSLYRLLRQGRSFEELARDVFPDTLLARHGGDLGWITWDQLDYDLAVTAFSLPLNGISEPVKSQFGYHILQVTGIKRNPLITETEFQARRGRVRDLLEYKIGDKLAGEYIERLMSGRKIRVNPRLLQFVGRKLGAALHRKPTPMDRLLNRGLSDPEVQTVQRTLWDIRNEVLATVDGQPVTVGQFVSGLRYVPYDAVYSSYKTALDFVLRDVALTREARRMGLGRLRSVREKVRLYEDYLLKVKLVRRLSRGVRVSDEEVRRFYEKRRADLFKNAPLDSVRGFIRQRLLEEKRLRIVPDLVAKLTEGMRIQKFPEVIHRYYDSLLAHGSGRKLTGTGF